jgi:hypothetical protein
LTGNSFEISWEREPSGIASNNNGSAAHSRLNLLWLVRLANYAAQSPGKPGASVESLNIGGDLMERIERDPCAYGKSLAELRRGGPFARLSEDLSREIFRLVPT